MRQFEWNYIGHHAVIAMVSVLIGTLLFAIEATGLSLIFRDIDLPIIISLVTVGLGGCVALGFFLMTDKIKNQETPNNALDVVGTSIDDLTDDILKQLDHETRTQLRLASLLSEEDVAFLNTLLKEIRESTNPTTAIAQIKGNGWHKDGTLIGADLRGATFVRVELVGTVLNEADLRGADLEYSNLTKSNLQKANLQYAYLQNANLTDVHFESTNLSYAHFDNSVLQGAILRDAQFTPKTLDGEELVTLQLLLTQKGKDIDLADIQSVLRRFGIDTRNFVDADNHRILDAAKSGRYVAILSSLHELTGFRVVNYDQLMVTHSMRGAIMPDSTRYNGRFNLRGDLEVAKRQGVNVYDEEEMAKFYGVTVEEYLSGQELDPEQSEVPQD